MTTGALKKARTRARPRSACSCLSLKETRPVESSGKASMHRITRQSPVSTQSWPHHTLVRKAWMPP